MTTGLIRPPTASRVARPNSTVPVIRAQFFPAWQARARRIHAAMAIRPEATPAISRTCCCVVTWLAVRFGKRFSMAVLVEPCVATELIR